MSAKPEAAMQPPKVQLIESDGIPLESPWHVAAISLLIEILTWHWRARTDFYVGGNMFLYFSEEQARNRDYRGPDFFFVNGVNRFPTRLYWVVWEEDGRYPNVIVELLSPSTAKTDRTTKKVLYERTFCTPEYYCYDPDTHELEGWRLGPKGRYRAIKPDKRGWLWSEELEMWLGNWAGTFQGLDAFWLRFYDANGQLIPHEAETERGRADAEHQRAEAEHQRAEVERQRAEAERQRAEVERQQAEVERQRAAAEEAKRAAFEEEVARLRARLAELEGKE